MSAHRFGGVAKKVAKHCQDPNLANRLAFHEGLAKECRHSGKYNLRAQFRKESGSRLGYRPAVDKKVARDLSRASSESPMRKFNVAGWKTRGMRWSTAGLPFAALGYNWSSSDTVPMEGVPMEGVIYTSRKTVPAPIDAPPRHTEPMEDVQYSTPLDLRITEQMDLDLSASTPLQHAAPAPATPVTVSPPAASVGVAAPASANRPQSFSGFNPAPTANVSQPAAKIGVAAPASANRPQGFSGFSPAPPNPAPVTANAPTKGFWSKLWAAKLQEQQQKKQKG